MFNFFNLRLCLCCILSLSFFTSCNKENPSVDFLELPSVPSVPEDGELFISEPGVPNGLPVLADIDESGGTLVSSDGRLTVTFPEGALSQTTQIGIQSISNNSPLGLQGAAYRLIPEGIVFNLPVQISFSFDNLDLNGIPPDFLWITTQKEDGSWEAALKSHVNLDNQTVDVQTVHFSDWALGRFIDLGLAPNNAVLAKEQVLRLFAVGFKQVLDDDDEFVPLYPINHDDGELVPLVPVMPDDSRLSGFQIIGWSLNGNMAPFTGNAGHLEPDDFTALYRAPSEVPAPNPVAVSLHLKANNYLGGISNFILTSNITILDNDLFLNLNVGGNSHTYYQWGINGSIPPNPNEVSIINCGLSEGALAFVGGITTNQGGYSHSFMMEVSGSQPGTYVLLGANCNGDDDVSYSADPAAGYAYSLNLVNRSIVNQICQQEYTCSDFIVKITAYDNDTKIVEGNFGGSLFYDPPEGYESCISSEELQVNGTFRLKVLS